MIALVVIPGDRCIVCRSSRAKDSNASFHRFPSDLTKKQLWTEEFGLIEGSIKPFSGVCSRLLGMGTQLAALRKHWVLDLHLLKSNTLLGYKSYKMSIVLSIADLAFDAAIAESFLQHSSYQK